MQQLLPVPFRSVPGFILSPVTVVSKALWVVMYTMNNHTYNARWSLTTDLQSTVSCLEAKDTTQSLFGDVGWSSKEALLP